MALSLNFNPPVIAHRGASGHAPENTIIAFIKAAQLGIKWLELDVMQSADGEPIVFHDDKLDRTTNGTGKVINWPYAYLRTLDAGAWFHPIFAGERIPSLQQVVEFLSNAKMAVNIEIKPLPGQEKPLVKRIVADLAPYLQAARAPVLFSSFSIAALGFLREQAPDCLIGLLMDEYLPNWQDICESLQCVSVHINQSILSLPLAQQIKNLNKKLLCYTVNDSVRATDLFALGVDAVFSDVPDRILQGARNIIQLRP